MQVSAVCVPLVGVLRFYRSVRTLLIQRWCIDASWRHYHVVERTGMYRARITMLVKYHELWLETLLYSRGAYRVTLYIFSRKKVSRW